MIDPSVIADSSGRRRLPPDESIRAPEGQTKDSGLGDTEKHDPKNRQRDL
jgi:hypothetical protein